MPDFLEWMALAKRSNILRLAAFGKASSLATAIATLAFLFVPNEVTASTRSATDSPNREDISVLETPASSMES